MLIKPAYNEEFRTFDFSPQLTGGEQLTDATVQVIRDDTGEDVTAAMISQVTVYNQVEVRYRLAGGMPGTIYRRVFRVATSNGQRLEEVESLRIR